MMSVFKNRSSDLNKFIDAVKCIAFLITLTLSGTVLSNAATWNGFSGAYVSGDNVFTVSSDADNWAGFANTNDSLNPISLPDGGIITFTAASSSSVDILFRLERLEYPDVEPSYTASVVNVDNSTESVSYTHLTLPTICSV